MEKRKNWDFGPSQWTHYSMIYVSPQYIVCQAVNGQER